MSAYLLDTNFLIYLTDENTSPNKRKMVLWQMEQALRQPENQFFLTPLIRYEVLRGVDWQNTEKMMALKQVLAQFESLDITQDVSDLAMNLYRLDKFEAEQSKQAKNLDKRKFDVFHYATAVVNHLEILSHDTDMQAIQALHRRYENSE